MAPSFSDIFQETFQVEALNEIFSTKIKNSNVKGIDRIDSYQFNQQLLSHLELIHKKCLEGSYKFTPYKEILQSKGKGKMPRVIAVPSIRDRIVLVALNKILSIFFAECISPKLANTYIHEIKNFINDRNINEIGILKTDIKNFYSSINRDRLILKVSERINSENFIKLIRKAIATPIVPKHYRRKDLKKYLELQGLPQGLSISNTLASIYVSDVDKAIEQNLSC